ncbi:MAG: hypothetical protein JST93_29285 [Acidobacteria bacterium]|nr:hypothetical protein [Acidobacteriota bacterium]
MRAEFAFRLLPPLLALAIYWPGLWAWFQQDDFAWMGLLREVREGASLWDTLLKPSQHGTWRPLSERAYFLLFPALFGYEAWPMRLAAFLTQGASLALLQDIAWRVTGSRWGAALAPLLWMAPSQMTIAMISNGAYVHVMGAFFLLLAAHSLIAGNVRLMWCAFGLGFLASESNVVFPGLATAWCLLFDRPQLRRVALLWALSIAYFAGHMWLAPKMSEGAYAMHFDASMFTTLWRYWRMIFEPENFTVFTGVSGWTLQLLGACFTATAIAAPLWRKQKTGILFWAWFVILLGPVLPLAGHVTGYYLTIPLAAFALLGAGMVSQWRPASVVIAAFIVLSAPCAYRATEWWRQRGEVAESLVRHVFAAHQANPDKILLLDGVTDEQFWAALAHYPFVERKKTYVFLTRGAEQRIAAHPESGVRMEEFFLPEQEEMRLRAEGRIVELKLNPQTASPGAL